MHPHENKLFILNNTGYWHLCQSNGKDYLNDAYYWCHYVNEDYYFRCNYKECRFKFPIMLGPSKYYEKPMKLHNGKSIYPMGPPYRIYWCHIEHAPNKYIELDITPFL